MPTWTILNIRKIVQMTVMWVMFDSSVVNKQQKSHLTVVLLGVFYLKWTEL